MQPQVSRWSRRAIRIGLLASFAVAPLVAQRTHDQARLTVGIAGGWIGGVQLWNVNNQPIYVNENPDVHDVFALHRSLRADMTLSGQLTYYQSDHLGYSAEFTYVGLGSEDACTLVQASGDPEPAVACATLNGRDRSASAVTMAGGVTVRPSGRAQIQPYGKALAGITLMPRSPIETTSDYTSPIDGQATSLQIYLDDGWKNFRPSGTLALGFVTAPGSGYQLQFEFRETWVALRTVTGPAVNVSSVPPTKGVVRSFPSIMVGFNIVLEKSRGRRY